MSRVDDFRKTLAKRTGLRYGKWHKIDLHNHTPNSYDYRYAEGDVADRLADSIRKNDLAIVMFTDHECLPDRALITEIQDKTGSLILRGVELNVFVDAFDLPKSKIGKTVFYHLLVGFDPDGSATPEYWLQEVYRRCITENREVGTRSIRGIMSPPEYIREILHGANAILIPAHLHTEHEPTKTRSVDDIYTDPTFLKHARDVFTALEVVDPKTADFFDGEHAETGKLRKTCIRSSDAHEPAEVGWRHSYVQMERPVYAELKAALELPFRTAIDKPGEPAAYVVGMNIRGSFFDDLWLSFSPYCNTLIGIKGSGKTSVFECLRFGLGAEVPTTREQDVNAHLGAILGASGTVAVLIKRPDGALVLVERSAADRVFVVTFEDDRQERFSGSEGLHFPAQVLGWHEIEQASTDRNVRKVYLDSIAGRTKVRSLELEARAIGGRITEKHGQCSQRYTFYRERHRQVDRLEELRRGLQALEDAQLIELRDRYMRATEQREALHALIERLAALPERAAEQVRRVITSEELGIPAGDSAIEGQLAETRQLLAGFDSDLGSTAADLKSRVEQVLTKLRDERVKVDAAYRAFLDEYSNELAILTPEQQRLLETHREVLEETRQLATLRAQRDAVKDEALQLLTELTGLCDELGARLDDRTRTRREAVERLNVQLEPYGVRLEVLAQQTAAEFQELSGKYATGAAALNEIRQRVPDRLAHLCIGRAYRELSSSWDIDYGRLLFESAELGRFLGVFEDDDLRIELKVGKAGEEYSPVEQLSAGQRCTAVFPILLIVDEGPLMVDQPEDNLDNRHIASAIAPSLRDDKRRRQMIFTSHNANLVVLSDSEAIVLFESDGSKGWVEAQGFFATHSSEICPHVMNVLDGGEEALQLRALKYGLKWARASVGGAARTLASLSASETDLPQV